MTDKVQRIREEVIRLYNQSLVNENRQSNRGLDHAASTSFGKSIACKELLCFIDSLSEESDLNWKEMSLQEKKDLIASLQKDVEEPVGEDLEEAAKTYTQDWFCQCPEECENAFKASANWKEQMMAKAIDGEVVATSDNGWESIRFYKKEHHCGQKVKVIIIKEDEL